MRILERRLIDRERRREPDDLVVRLLGENPLGLKGLAERPRGARRLPDHDADHEAAPTNFLDVGRADLAEPTHKPRAELIGAF